MHTVNDINISRPCVLTVTGDSQRVEVLRSPLVSDSKRAYAPVLEFLDAHGLVLASCETREDDGWLLGRVETSVWEAAV